MTRYDFPAGIDGDVLIMADGLTVVCYSDIARGFVVERFADPVSREVLYTNAASTGCGHLAVVDGLLWAAFRDNRPDAHAMAWGMGQPALLDQGAVLGNQPIAWASDGGFGRMTPPSFAVEVDSTVYGPGAGTGLARIDGTDPNYVPVTWDHDFYINHWDTACVLPDGDRVSQAHDGGILCSFGGKEGTILTGQGCYQPRLAAQPNGQYSILYGMRTSHGAGPQTFLTDVSAADFDQPVLPAIPAFTRPMILASYDTGQAKGDNGSVQPANFALWHFSAGKWFPYFDLEQHEPVTEHPCVAYCDIADIGPLAVLKPGDIAAVNVYPTAGQPLGDLGAAALATIHVLVSRGLFVNLVGCAWNRLGTLSDQFVLDGMKLVRGLADEPGVIGVEWFGLNRGTSLGYFKPLYQEAVDLFSSPGWPAWPAAPLPPEPPMPLMQDPLREQSLRDAGKLAAKFWNISEQEGYQGCRE